MTTGGLADQATRGSVGSWLMRAWQASRVAVATSIAESAVIWLGIEALSNASVGPIPFGPVAVAMLLIGVVPTLPLPRSGIAARAVGLLTVLVAAAVLVRFLVFPDGAWWNWSWLGDIGGALLLHDGPAVMPIWVPILVAAGAWWWRQRRGDNAPDDVRTSLRVGAVALFVLAAIGAFSGMASEGEIATAGTVFFAAILLAMSWVRQQAVHPGELGGGTGVATLTSLGGVAVVLVLATALVALANPAAFATLVWLLGPVIWLVRLAILGLSGLLLIVTYPFFWVFEWLMSHRAAVPPPTQDAAMPSPSPSGLFESTAGTAAMPDGLRVVLAAMILAALVLLIGRQALRRTIALAAPTDVEQHVELDLRSLLRRRRSRPGPEPDPLAGLRNDPAYRDTVAIRELYTRFLRASADAGLDRRRAETARHHACRVAGAIGTPIADIRLLDGTYEDIRYGAVPATAEQRRAVTAAWERVAPRLSAMAAGRADHPSRRRRR